jgi:enoyl-CoA hydratase
MTPVHYELHDGIATVTMDDGRANALSPTMLHALGAAFDRADAEGAASVVLTGRPGRFSGGFDLGVLVAGGPDAEAMVVGGFRLAERLLASPVPVVAACTGHAVAMGSFLLCATDLRVGAAGDFRIHANEVAIGITMPHPAIHLLRARLTPSAFERAVNLAEAFDPAAAVAAGFLDRLAEPDDVVRLAREIAASYAGLDLEAHHRTKLRTRAALLDAVSAGIDAELTAAVPAPG